MATTSIPAQPNAAVDDEAKRRSDEERRAVAEANQKSGASSGGAKKSGEAAGDLDAQARAAVEERAHAFFDSTVSGARIRMNAELQTADPETRKRREADFNANADKLRKEAVDDAMKIYEDAIERRGAHVAALDQLQGGIGLPADPQRRQIEVERRIKEGDAAMSAQSGVGTVPDNLEGRLRGTRIDEYFGDAGRAEFNPHVQEGHGQNIAQQAIAAHRLQQIAPEAPMTQENVNDPHGAKDRMSKDRNQQASQPVAGRIDQGGQPGGHPATAGGLMATDPLMPKSVNTQANQDQRRQDANQPKQDAQGLTSEQLAQRDKVAGGGDKK